MMTIIDPAGSPLPVYNLNGRTISSLAASGSSQAAGAVIVAYSELTIVKVSTGSGAYAVVLPSSANVGDLVEIYGDGVHAVNVFPSASQQILTLAVDDEYSLVAPLGARFRRLSSTLWGVS